MKPVLLVAALLAGSPASAADWRLSGESENAHAYIDVESMRLTGQETRFRQMLVYRDAVKGVADNAVASVAANCDKGTYRQLSVLAYMGSKLVDEWTPGETKRASPETLIAQSIDIACHRIPVKYERVDDPYALSQMVFHQQ